MRYSNETKAIATAIIGSALIAVGTALLGLLPDSSAGVGSCIVGFLLLGRVMLFVILKI